MNKTYLDKVVKQMVDETVKVGSDRMNIYLHHSPLPLLTLSSFLLFFF